MEIITKGIAAGKTYDLIIRSHGTQQYIVCINQREAHRITEKAIEMGLSIPFPITFDEFLNKRYSTKNMRGFLIDNAEYLIQKLSTVPITAITITKENDNKPS